MVHTHGQLLITTPGNLLHVCVGVSVHAHGISFERFGAADLIQNIEPTTDCEIG